MTIGQEMMIVMGGATEGVTTVIITASIIIVCNAGSLETPWLERYYFCLCGNRFWSVVYMDRWWRLQLVDHKKILVLYHIYFTPYTFIHLCVKMHKKKKRGKCEKGNDSRAQDIKTHAKADKTNTHKLLLHRSRGQRDPRSAMQPSWPTARIKPRDSPQDRNFSRTRESVHCKVSPLESCGKPSYPVACYSCTWKEKCFFVLFCRRFWIGMIGVLWNFLFFFF